MCKSPLGGRRATYLSAEEAKSANPEATFLLTIWLEKAMQLTNADFFDQSDPYLVLSLASEMQEPQRQRSSTRCNSHTPGWAPAERFEFAVASGDLIVLRMFDQDVITSDDPIGSSTLKVADFQGEFVAEEQLGREVIVKLRDDTDNSELGGAVHLRARCDALDSPTCFLSAEDVVVENERYSPFKRATWSENNLLPTDPKAWLSVAGAPGASLTEVAPPVREGYVVVENWHFCSPSDGTSGWEYAMDFAGHLGSRTGWHREKCTASFVRRRFWRRLAIRKDAQL